jgi:hypothetical protein
VYLIFCSRCVREILLSKEFVEEPTIFGNWHCAYCWHCGHTFYFNNDEVFSVSGPLEDD